MVFFSSLDIEFFAALIIAVIIGFCMGLERETRHKAAGVSTHILVIVGAMLFTFISSIVDQGGPGRIAGQVITGIGFLGAGLIFKEGGNVHNLTTAASIWYAAAVGMALGFGLYSIGIVAGIIGVFIPRIPSVQMLMRKNGEPGQ
jgi:putative Mg2+ transporter-C (MgtC) family protein